MPVRDEYFSLLKEWLDALLPYILNDPAHKTLDGAIICPACSVIHGRCADAIYPFMCMADLTGEEKYLTAAKKLFDWSEYMLCDDGSMYNDSQAAWNGITVFASMSLYNALSRHGHLLSAAEKTRWEARLRTMAEWLRTGITAEGSAVINYKSTNSAAMACIGHYFNDARMLDSARKLAHHALGRLSPNRFLCGEGNMPPTQRGATAIDVGYNIEESLPSLYRYAEETGDAEALEQVKAAVDAHLQLMLPDGAWDNSFGTRNFKWTYWGSRTSDGCQGMLNGLGKSNPVYAEAAYRNLQLYRRCTEGLLYGGPDYKAHGELPCVHHTFCHAKVLAEALDEGVAEFERCELPSDRFSGIKYYPEALTYRLGQGDWRMTVTASDIEYMPGGHVSGGCISLLWNKAAGPVLATANTDYSMQEAHNQQLTRRKALQGCLCPRLERNEGRVYSQMYDYAARLTQEGENVLIAEGVLEDYDHKTAAGAQDSYRVTYSLTDKGLTIAAQVAPESGICLILPVIRTAFEGGKITVSSRGGLERRRELFNLAPGLEAVELIVKPDARGEIWVEIA